MCPLLMDKSTSMYLISDTTFQNVLQVLNFLELFIITCNDLPNYIFGVHVHVVYAWVSVRSVLFSLFYKNKLSVFVDNSLRCLWSAYLYCSWFLLLYLQFCYLILLVSSAIYCNSLFSRDYLDKREELRQAREERFVYNASILPFGCLHFLYSLLSCIYIFNSACTEHFNSKRLL